MSSNLCPLSLRFSHSYKSVLAWAAVCLWGHVGGGREDREGGWVGGLKGWWVRRLEEWPTHPFLFFVRVQLVVHRLDHASSANTHTQTAHSVMFPEGEEKLLCSRYKHTRFVLSKCILIIMHLQKQLGRCLSIHCLCVSTGPWHNPVVSGWKNLKQV